MEYAVLNDGSRMPVFGLGTWDLRGEACTETIIQAINIGYRLIDTAQMYRNEKEVGKGIRASGISRDELFITSKVISPDRSYDAVIKAVDRSLEALGLDSIDLYLLHEPYDTAQEMYAALKQASLDRGRVVYNLRTQCYEVTCGDAVFNDIEKRKLLVDAFELSNCRYEFVNLGTHYHIAELTGNPALDEFEYGV